MKTEIDPNALYWASFNRFEMRLPAQCVIDCSHSGKCDDDVDAWVDRIRQRIETDNFPNKPTPDKIRDELSEFGAWDDEELKDDAQNFKRIVWLAACNIAEGDALDCSEPVKD